MRMQVIAAAMMFTFIAAAEGHSWYSEKCCHGKDCHPVPCE